MTMSVRSVELFHVAMPLKKAIRHASHERVTSDNLVVRVTLDDGRVGYGEGVPRSYVTGETIETTFATLQTFDVDRHLGRPNEYAEVVRRLEAMMFPATEADPRGMAGNTARCALEIAILDAFGRRYGQSIARAIQLVDAPGLERKPRPSWVRYSGAITAETPHREVKAAWLQRGFGFAQVKVKVGVSGQDDPARLARLRRILGSRMDVRLDANEAWPAAMVRERVRPLLPFAPSALEQPVPHAEVDALAAIRPRLGVPVMLDESLCGYPDAIRSIERKTADLFNIRLSKCGGIIPSLRIAALARRSGIGLQLGCHPGETGLLSAAGRHVASNVRGFRWVEGSYDAHILAANLTTRNLSFFPLGFAPPLHGPGLGVDVDPDALERLTVRRQEVVFG
jgi:L-alanine-DL-glutamate epimerase-like enolase superfamily enzyme